MRPLPTAQRDGRSWNRGLAAALLVLPLLLALMVRPSTTTSRLAGLALMAEPLLLGVAGYLVLGLLWRRWWLSALTLLLGTAGAVGVLHAPGTPEPPPRVSIPWASVVAPCVAAMDTPTAPVRVLSWNATGSPLGEEELETLVALRPDLAVVTGLRDARFLETFAEILPGETLTIGSAGDLVGI